MVAALILIMEKWRMYIARNEERKKKKEKSALDLYFTFCNFLYFLWFLSKNENYHKIHQNNKKLCKYTHTRIRAHKHCVRGEFLFGRDVV